jgi:hypothetical protein
MEKVSLSFCYLGAFGIGQLGFGLELLAWLECL